MVMREPKWYQQQNDRRNKNTTSYIIYRKRNRESQIEQVKNLSAIESVQLVVNLNVNLCPGQAAQNYVAKTLVTLRLWVKKTVHSTPNLKALEAIQDQYCPLEYDFYINIYYHVPIGCFFMFFHWGNPLSTNQWELEAIQPRYPRESIRKATKPMEIHGFPARIVGFHPLSICLYIYWWLRIEKNYPRKSQKPIGPRFLARGTGCPDQTPSPASMD